MTDNGSQLVNETLDEVVNQICESLQNGERVDIDGLADAHPEIASQLRSLYPTLLAISSLESSNAVGQLHRPASDDQQNMQLGDFRIIRQIGRGGMGVVYEAEQQSIRRSVALKILPLAALVDARALQRFKNEVAAIATLDHPHIVSVYSIGEDRGIHYFAMQLIRGQSLAAVIAELRARTQQEGSVTGASLNQVVSDLESETNDQTFEKKGASHFTDETAAETVARGRSSTVPSRIADPVYFRNVVGLMLQAADALQHAHDHGIVHRDVKPANLLLDTTSNLFVTDFGLARIETGAGVTMTGDIMGTLRYMSPEQVLANRVVIDHRTDIYSLGATLHELLTLQPMWSGNDKAELIRQISFEEPVEPRKFNPAIPADLNTIVLKSISKNPADRYQNAQLFADDLQRFLQHKTILARRPTMVQKVAKWTRRNPAIMWATSAVLIIASCLLGINNYLLSESEQETRAALMTADENNSRAETNLRKAEDAIKQMRTINDFVLKNIVRSANPNNKTGSKDITVRDSLLAANDLIEETFADDPILRSHVKANFGDYLYAVGDYAVARTSLEDAVNVYTEEYGKESSYTLDAKRKLTKVYRELGELDLALSSAHEVLQTTELLYGRYDRDAVDSLFQLGVVYSKQRQHENAQKTLSEAVKLSRSGKFPSLEALSTMELGSISFYQQKYEQAESYWLQALALFEESNSHANIIAIKSNLAKVYWETGRREKSLNLTEQVLAQMTERHGATHPKTLSVLRQLAVKKYFSKDQEGATEDFRRLLDRTRTQFGPQHERTAKAMTDLGTALSSSGEVEEAIELQQQALEIEQEKYGEQHPRTIHILGVLAQSYGQIKDLENAGRYFHKAIDARLAIATEKPQDWGNAVSLGGLYCNYGIMLRDEKNELDEAAKCFSEGIEFLKPAKSESGRRFLVNNYMCRAETFGLMQRWAEAIADADLAILNATTPGRKDGMLLWKARLLAQSRQTDESIQIVDDVLTREEDDTGLYLAARVLALCAGDAKTTGDDDNSNATPSIESRGLRCIQLLEQILDSGYFEKQNRIDDFLEEQDFDAIRSLDEFQAFCQKVALAAGATSKVD